MKRNLIILLASFVVVFFNFSLCVSDEVKSEDADYFERALSVLEIVDSNTIKLKEKCDSLYAARILLDNYYNMLPELSVRIGESFMLSDLRHASSTYKLVAIKNDKVTFEVKNTFNAISFGGGIKESQGVLESSPFKYYCYERKFELPAGVSYEEARLIREKISLPTKLRLKFPSFRGDFSDSQFPAIGLSPSCNVVDIKCLGHQSFSIIARINSKDIDNADDAPAIMKYAESIVDTYLEDYVAKGNKFPGLPNPQETADGLNTKGDKLSH